VYPFLITFVSVFMDLDPIGICYKFIFVHEYSVITLIRWSYKILLPFRIILDFVCIAETCRNASLGVIMIYALSSYLSTIVFQLDSANARWDKFSLRQVKSSLKLYQEVRLALSDSTYYENAYSMFFAIGLLVGVVFKFLLVRIRTFTVATTLLYLFLIVANITIDKMCFVLFPQGTDIHDKSVGFLRLAKLKFQHCSIYHRHEQAYTSRLLKTMPFLKVYCSVGLFRLMYIQRSSLFTYLDKEISFTISFLLMISSSLFKQSLLF